MSVEARDESVCEVCFPGGLTLLFATLRVYTQWPGSGCTQQLDD